MNPNDWLFGRHSGAAASAAVGTWAETTEERYSEVRGAAGAAYPQGGVSGYHGAAGSALEESGARDGSAASLHPDQSNVRAAGLPGRLSRHRSDGGGGRGQGSADELDSPNDDLPAEDADSAVQGLAAATGSSGRLARPRSDRANALEASQLKPEAETEDAENAEWAAEEADPEVQGLAMPAGASDRLAGLSALSRISALGSGKANPVMAEDSDLAAENGAEEEDIEALYPAPAARGGANGDDVDLWRARTATDQGLALEAAARRDPNPATYPVADFSGAHRGSSGAEQALADKLQGRMNPGASPGLDPAGQHGRGAEGAHHTELVAANQRVAGVLREREAAQADARVYNPSRAEAQGATAAPRAAWWGKRSTAGSAAAEQPRAGSGAGVHDVSGRAGPNSEGKASSEGAEHQGTRAESVEHGHQHGADPVVLRVSTGARAPSAPALDVEGADAESVEHGYLHGADPDGLGVSAGARAPPGPALDVEGADAGVLLDPPDTTTPQDENSRRAPGPGWRWFCRVWVTLWNTCFWRSAAGVLLHTATPVTSRYSGQVHAACGNSTQRCLSLSGLTEAVCIFYVCSRRLIQSIAIRCCRRRALVKAAARHSWAGYVLYAYGHDELAPLSRAEPTTALCALMPGGAHIRLQHDYTNVACGGTAQLLPDGQLPVWRTQPQRDCLRRELETLTWRLQPPVHMLVQAITATPSAAWAQP